MVLNKVTKPIRTVESRGEYMTRLEYIKSLSEAQMALMIWTVLLAGNSPLKEWRCISDVASWLSKEWIEGEYVIY